MGRITAALFVQEEDGKTVREAATPQTKTKDWFILPTVSLSSLYYEFNLNEFNRLSCHRLYGYVLLLETVGMNCALEPRSGVE